MTEASKHLTYFKVENFKCFDSFEMEDIGQFNLILGDNNVGKTSVLEALLFDEKNEKFLRTLIYIFVYKAGNYWNLSNKDTLAHSRLYNTILSFYLNGSGYEIDFHHKFFDSEEKWHQVAANIAVVPGFQIWPFSEILPMIFSNDLYDEDLSEFYSANIQFDKTKKDNLIRDLSPIVKDIDVIEISNLQSDLTPVLIIGTKNSNKVLPLPIYGDGTIKLFRILVETIKNSSNRLMIDEIDSGIHYSRFKDYWRTIIKSAANNNVQLFMTTHNVECLKYLKEVLEEDDMKEYQERTRSYTLIKVPNGGIKSLKSNFEQFEYAIEQGIEMR